MGKTKKTPNHRQLAPYMKEFSRQMRKNPTDAENKLWQELRNKKLGFGFRRQFVIDSKYIADFVCLEKRLIIECDGGQHAKIPDLLLQDSTPPLPPPARGGEQENGKKALPCEVESNLSPIPCGGGLGVGKDSLNHPDIQRDFYLESQNFRILRFWNNEILENLEGVLYVIKETLESDFADTKSTHPLTPSAREGEQVDSNSAREGEQNASPSPCGRDLGRGSHAKDSESNLAQIYHYDLYGKRKDKYAFLQSNGLESIEWSELSPKAPFYLFIPQNESLRAEYEKGISVKDIFKLSNVGITSGKDSFCISKSDSQESLQELKNNITKFMNLDCESARKEFGLGDDSKSVWQIQKAKNDLEKTNNNPNNYIKIHYRPFDFRWTYYTSQSSGFLGRPRYEVMKHFLGNDNVGLVCDRGCKLQQIDNIFVANNVIDLHLTGSGSYIYPLYLKIENEPKSESKSPLPCEVESNLSPLPCGGGLGVGKNTTKSKYTPPLAPPARGGEQMSNPQNENVGLVCDRGCKLQQIDNIFVANNVIDLHLTGSGSYIYPLYLKIENEPKSESKSPLPCEVESNLSPLPCGGGLGVGKSTTKSKYTPPLPPPARGGEQEGESPARGGESMVENFTPEFRAFVDKKYGQIYAPEVILGYIYAVLYHKDYREKYVDFLKIDFPKVPFVKSKKDFLALSALGCDLVDLHLMRVDLSGESVGEPLFGDLSDKNEKIQKIAYNAESKRLFVNASLYFENVSAEVWAYKIGGYAVLDKYLKSHKGESIDYAHFERVIKTLHKSLQVESKIAAIGIE
ncbi:type ISP restriction/modification enzyme [Helicobacter sp. 23-1045]